MKGLTPQQNHDYSSITFWIKQVAENAPALALQKICTCPGFRKLLIKLVESNLPVMIKHTAALQKEITRQRHFQKQPKSSKQVDAVLLPVSSGISKKPRVDHAAKAAYLSEKLHLLPAMFAKYAASDYRSDIEAEEEVIVNIAQAQEVSGTEIVRYTGNRKVSGTATPKQKETGAKGKKNDEGTDDEETNIADDDAHEVAEDHEISTARKDYIAYCTEQELIRGTPEALERMKLYCQDLQQDDGTQISPGKKFKDEVKEVFVAGTKLGFDLIKERILDFAEKKLSLRTQIPATAWDLEDPISIFNAIEHAAAQSDDAKIHQAYGQMQLYTSINDLVRKGRRSGQRCKKDADRHELPQLEFLDYFADRKVGKKASLEAKWHMRARFRKEYYGGMNWLDMANLFEGTGVVFVFVVASKF